MKEDDLNKIVKRLGRTTNSTDHKPFRTAERNWQRQIPEDLRKLGSDLT
jgi:hypothetical protein